MPLIFLLVFLFSIAIAPAAFASNGNFGNSSDEGRGTAENPYLIEDEADLIVFRDIVNGTGNYSGNQNTDVHAKLTRDITLENEWTPIANYSYTNQDTQYAGTFDGGGYTIYIISISGDSAGFFGRVGSNGVVKNLTIASGENAVLPRTISGTTYAGGIVGWNEGGTVENCGYLQDGEVNSNINAIGYGNGTNVGSFSEDEMDKIAVTLSASIADSEIAADGETTITLTTQPGEWADVMSANGLAVTGLSDSSGIVSITPNEEDGTLTVKGNGNTGETTITVTAMLYTYNYSFGTYETYVATTYPFNFDLTVNDVADDEETGEEETGTPDEEDTGGDDNGDDSSSTESGSTSGGSSGGGCNAGTGALALLALIPLALRRKR